MSRAFVKEQEDREPLEPVLERPVEPRPITPRGYAALEGALAGARDEAARRELARKLDSVVAIPPPADRSRVAFGAQVTVAGAGPAPRSFEIVGEDEVDVAAGRVGAGSPLARALLGTRVGDRATWQRPAGPIEIAILEIGYPE
ncbi:MAG: GreA/GreB family elongation factor [Vulcanimicrobiaceae bacterium]